MQNAKQFAVNILAFRVSARSGEDRIRTLAENAGKTGCAVQDGAEYGALSTVSAVDAELQVIIDVWPGLSDDTKAGIVAMVRATERK